MHTSAQNKTKLDGVDKVDKVGEEITCLFVLKPLLERDNGRELGGMDGCEVDG